MTLEMLKSIDINLNVFNLSESKKNAGPSKSRKGLKNSATAAKVALMKLKLHATGDKGLPQVFIPDLCKFKRILSVNFFALDISHQINYFL